MKPSLIDTVITKYHARKVDETVEIKYHSAWTIEAVMGSDVLIKCTCHKGENQDSRWIKMEQLP